jgi:exosome complex RNA-binding protein Rrp42 (RNase PH superfamily)
LLRSGCVAVFRDGVVAVVDCCLLAPRVLAASGAMNLHSLCVVPGKRCWVIYIDVVVRVMSALTVALALSVSWTLVAGGAGV